MSGLSAVEVGKVGVRAVPLTDRFRSQLLAKLRKIEKTVDFHVDVVVDKVRLNRAKTRASLQQQLARLDGLTIDVDAKVNSRELVDKIHEATRTNIRPVLDEQLINRLRRNLDDAFKRLEVHVRPTIDDDLIRQRVHQMGTEFDALSKRLAHDIMSPADAAALRHRLNEISDHIDKVARDRETRIDANPFTAWAAARLKWLVRPRIVEIIPQVSKAALAKAATTLAALSGARLSFDYLRRFSDWISEVDKKLPRLAFGVTGISTAFSALMGSISGVVGIGDGLAALLPSFLLLPGLFAGAALSGVSLFVALKHSKEELAELGPSYTNLGKIIRTAFWEDARPAIIDFSNSIMPQLESSFDRTSRALGRFTANLAGSFKREFAGGRLEAMFEGLAKSWDVLATGTDAFAGAITNLGLVASQYMPRLAEWFVRQADSFDNWLSMVSTDGRLSDWIEESIDAYYALWDVAAATTGIFQGLWKAAEAGGGKGLRGFADMLLSWEKAVNGAKWQDTLTSMFRGAGKALSGFGDGLERVGEMLHFLRGDIEYLMGASGRTLGDFLGSIADALARPEVGQGMRAFIDGISSGLKSLEPAMEPLSDAFASLLDFIGRLAEAVGPVLSKALEKLAPVLEKVLDSIDLEGLSDSMVDTLERLAPTFDELGDALVKVLPGLLDDLAELLPLLVDLVGILGPLSAALEPLKWLWDNTGLGAGIDQANAIRDYFMAFEESGGSAAAAAAAFRDSLLESETQIGTFWGNVLAGWELMVFNTALAWERMKTTVATKITEIATDIQQFPQKAATALTGFAAALQQKADEAGEAFRSAIATKLTTAVGFVQTIPGRIVAVFSGAGSWLYNSGVSVLQGFINGIMAKVESAKAAISSAMSSIRGFFPFSPAKEGPFSGRGWVAFAGQSVGETFGTSIAESVRAQRTRISSELSQVQREFGGLALAGFNASSARNKSDATASAVPNVVNFTVNNPTVKDGFSDEWDEANEKGLLP